jgi:hypothetical protein
MKSFKFSRLANATVLVLLSLGLTALGSSANAASADLSGSARGITLDVFSRLSPLEINSIHSWEIVLTDEQGPIEDAALTVTGGMPEHNHGMPTQPQITQQLAAGRYLLEGVRFHMPGLWRITAVVTRESAPVTIVIDFEL